MTDAYLWFKALHIISVIAWMAGLLYLPRLFVYHAAAERGSVQAETFKVMERRLYRAIMTPAMILSLIFGGALLGVPGVVDWSGDVWLWVKLASLVCLLAAHGMMGRWRRALAEDRNTRSARFFRLANEVPTLIMILVVIMVVVKPF